MITRKTQLLFSLDNSHKPKLEAIFFSTNLLQFFKNNAVHYSFHKPNDKILL